MSARARRAGGFLRLVNVRGLRLHPLRAVLALVTVTAGVSIIVAITVEMNSVSSAMDRFGARLAGPAPLRVVGPTTRGGITEEVQRAIAGVEGVATAVPMIRAVTEVSHPQDGRGDTVLALGLDCAAERLLGPFGCGSPADDAMAPTAFVSSRLADRLGSNPALRTNTGPLPLTGAQPVADLNDFNDGQVVLLALPVADAAFAREGRVDVVYVLPNQDVPLESLRQRLTDRLGPELAVLTAAQPPTGFDATGILMPLLGVFALVGLGVGGLLVYQVINLSVAERRRDLAVANALGAAPALITVGFLAEALLLGLVGSLLGCGAGIALARPLVASASGLTEQFLGVAVTPVVGPEVLLVGVATGVATALIAAAVPSRGAAGLDLAGEISGRVAREEDRPRGTWRRAGLLTGTGAAGVLAARLGTINGGLNSWQPTLTRVGLVVAVAGLFAAAGALAPNLIRLAARPLRLGRPQPAGQSRRGPNAPAALSVALVNLTGDARRTASLATAVAIPVATAGLLSGLLLAVEQGSVDVTQVAAQGRAVVTTTRFSDYGPIEAKVSPRSLAAVDELPETGELSKVTEVEVGFTSADLVYVQAQERPTFPYAVLAGDSPAQVIDRGDVIIGSMLARARSLGPGDRITLPTLRGLRQWRVGAVWADPQSGGRTMLLPWAEAERYFGSQPTGLLFAAPAPGSSTEDVVRAVRGESFDQPVQARGPAGYGRGVASEISRFLQPFSALQAGLLSVAFISVFSTLLLVGIQRRREMATLSAVGATPGRLLAVATLEAVLAGTAGAFLGAGVAVGVLDAVRQDAVIDIGMLPPFSYPTRTVLLYGFLAVAAAALAAQIPGWRASRLPIAQVLRDQ